MKRFFGGKNSSKEQGEKSGEGGSVPPPPGAMGAPPGYQGAAPGPPPGAMGAPPGYQGAAPGAPPPPDYEAGVLFIQTFKGIFNIYFLWKQIVVYIYFNDIMDTNYQ